MSMVRTRGFREGESLIIPLPAEVGFEEGTELVAVRSGSVLTIHRPMDSTARMVEKLRRLPAPPGIERRDAESLDESC